MSFGLVKTRVGFVKEPTKVQVAGVDVVVEPSATVTGAAKPKKPKVSLERLLAKAEKNQSRLEEIRQQKKFVDAGTGLLAADELWDAALKRASGEKVKDDPKLLRKTIRKVKQKKAKSAREWYVACVWPLCACRFPSSASQSQL